MNSLARWLSESLFPIVKAGGVWVINAGITALAGLVSGLANLLPEWNPYDVIQLNLDSNTLAWLNWLFPIDVAVSLLSGYISIMFSVFIVKLILRWVKAL